MQRESRREYWRRVFGKSVLFALFAAGCGALWGLALGFNIAFVAKLGAIIGGLIVFVQSLGISRYATSGMTMIFGMLGGICASAALIVWLVRSC